jgi:CubicO group peptidase (beta-lactamase class C family)
LPARLSAASAAMAHYLDRLASTGRFSGAVLVARDGHVLLDAGYGLADRATRTLNAPGTIFQIGSVTKQFTAMAIAILAASGRLRLDAPACEYLPGCPPSWKAISLTELLTHTSGIEDWSAWHLTGPLPGDVTDPIAAIVTEAEREPLAFPPGTEASYSNPAYVVLGDIIERVSGMG